MKKIILSLSIALIVTTPIGGYFFIKQEQKKIFNSFFHNPYLKFFKFDNAEYIPFYETFYDSLNIKKSPVEIYKYNVCLFKDEIFHQNKKTFTFDQKQLETTFNTTCNQKKFIIENEAYWANAFNLCTKEKKCIKFPIRMNDVFLTNNKEAYTYKTNKQTLAKIDFNAFMKDELNIQDANNVLLYYIHINGIGNQLFQYWGAQIYAKEKGLQPIALIHRQVHDTFGFKGPDEKLKNKKIQSDFEYFNHIIDFDNNLLVFNQNPLSIQNFRGYEEYIQENTKFKNELSGKSKEIANQMKNEISVSIHIRRGDFKLSSYTPILDKKYYEESIFLMKNKFKTPHFYVFSDEIQWAKENLKIDGEHTFVDWTTSAEEDLQLMTNCNHHIIANSTFSWWGAFLSKNKDKIVLLPPEGFYHRGAQHMSVDKNWMVVEK